MVGNLLCGVEFYICQSNKTEEDDIISGLCKDAECVARDCIGKARHIWAKHDTTIGACSNVYPNVCSLNIVIEISDILIDSGITIFCKCAL